MPYVTSASKLENFNDNWLYASGTESVFYEYDKWFQLIASFSFTRQEENKTIEEKDYEEDNPPADNTVTYTGISKFDLTDYYFSDEVVIYKDETDEEENTESMGN